MDYSTVKISLQQPSRTHRRFVGTAALLTLLFAGSALTFPSLHAEEPFTPTNSADFKSGIQPFLEQHCVKCHGEKKKKAKFFLHDIDGVITNGKDVVRWEKILEMVSLQDMPPEDEDQPSKTERSKVLGWITAELLFHRENFTPTALPNPSSIRRDCRALDPPLRRIRVDLSLSPRRRTIHPHQFG